MTDLPEPGATLREVLPGTADYLDELAGTFESYVGGAVAACRGLHEMDSGGWVGEAADAFLSSVGKIVENLDGAAFAFQEAALALRTYTAVFREAQADVRQALMLLDQADTETCVWSARNSDTLPPDVTTPHAQLSFDDPGDPLRHRAHTLITEAKARVAAAADHAAERLRRAADHAPDRPGFWSRAAHAGSEVAGGVIDATVGMATFAFKLTPVYELIDPAGYVENGVGIVKGLTYGTTHPVDFAKAVVDWDTWVKSPGRAIGHLLPMVALAVASAGTGIAGEAGEAAAGGIQTAAKTGEITEELTAAERGGQLRDVLATPKVSDPKLQNYVENLYKWTTNPARVGTGTTADAVRNEVATGQPTGGTFHSVKAQETIRGLERWLRRNPDAPYLDRLVARSLMDDLRDALGGPS